MLGGYKFGRLSLSLATYLSHHCPLYTTRTMIVTRSLLLLVMLAIHRWTDYTLFPISLDPESFDHYLHFDPHWSWYSCVPGAVTIHQYDWTSIWSIPLSTWLIVYSAFYLRRRESSALSAIGRHVYLLVRWPTYFFLCSLLTPMPNSYP